MTGHGSDATRRPFSSLVNDAISRAQSQSETLVPLEEDSDDWLNVDADMLDGILTGAQRATDEAGRTEDKEILSEDTIAQAQAERLKGLAEKVEKFVEGQGDVEGARFDE